MKLNLEQWFVLTVLVDYIKIMYGKVKVVIDFN